MKIGEKLRLVIKKEYKSLKTFAEKIDINYNQLSNYLNDYQKPSIDFLDRFIKEFPNTDLNWLLREGAEDFGVKEKNFRYKSPMKNDEIIDEIEELLNELKSNLAQK